MSMSWADNSVKNQRNWPISNPKPDFQNINEVWWKSIDMYSSYPPEMNIGWTDRHMNDQGDTIIPRHYSVVRSKHN